MAACIGLVYAASSALIAQPSIHSGVNEQGRLGSVPSMVVLKGISPLLSAELLYILRAVGHGDVSIIELPSILVCV